MNRTWMKVTYPNGDILKVGIEHDTIVAVDSPESDLLIGLRADDTLSQMVSAFGAKVERIDDEPE